MNMTRRQAGITLAGAAMTAALAACSGQTPAQIASTVVSDVSLVVNGTANIVASLVGVPQDVVTTVTTKAQDIQTVAGKIVAGMTQAAGQPIVQQIGTDLSAVSTAIAPYLPSNTAVQTILADMQTLLPLIEAGVGMLVAGASLASADPAAARARLAALPKRSV